MDSPEPNDPLNNPTATDASSSAENSGRPDLSEQLALAQKEAAANQDRYLRSVADLENFRRRTVREKDDLRQFAASRVLEELLPVMDNLGLGLSAAQQPGADLKTLTSGIEMVLTQLKSALANHGLKEINPLGQPFDANQHESLSAQPSEKIPEGNVVTVVRTGYSLNGRLLRPASVVVSSGSAKEAKK